MNKEHHYFCSPTAKDYFRAKQLNWENITSWSTSSLSSLQVFLVKKRQKEIKLAHYPEASDLENRRSSEELKFKKEKYLATTEFSVILVQMCHKAQHPNIQTLTLASLTEDFL